MTGNLTDTTCQTLTDTGRSNFLYLTIIFRIIVKEFIMRNDFSNRERNRLLFGLINTHRDFRTFQILFYHYLRTLHHCLADGRSKLIGNLNL